MHDGRHPIALDAQRSEEHTSELQSQSNLVCRLLLEKKNNNAVTMNIQTVVTSVARTASVTSSDGAVYQAPGIDTPESDTMARLRGRGSNMFHSYYP